MNSKLQRIQFEVPEIRVGEFDKLMAKAGLRTRKDLIENALTLYEWAVAQREAGRMIASVDEARGEFRELLMPSLAYVRNEFNTKRSRNDQVGREEDSAQEHPQRLAGIPA